MDDEFLNVAKKEIHDDLCSLETLLSTCKNDHDVIELAFKFQTHTHKIKGLAPMMGRNSLGKVAASLDSLMKKSMNADVVGIFSLLSEILPFMMSLMIEPEFYSVKVNQVISKIEDLQN